MRADWDSYFLGLAQMAATRSTCDRRHVGAIIVQGQNVVSTGYNGSMSGAPHCDDVGHLMEDGHCVATIHAEANAVISAAKHGVSTRGASMFVTHSPCWKCFQLIVQAGIRSVVYGEEYRADERVLEFADRLGIELRRGSVNGIQGPELRGAEARREEAEATQPTPRGPALSAGRAHVGA